MTPDQAVAELEAKLRAEPRNLGLRLRLAAALREAGRGRDAVNHYHALARAYRSAGDLRQAMASCHSALSIEPGHAEMRILLAQLQAEDAKAEAPIPRPPGVPASKPELSTPDLDLTDPEAAGATLEVEVPVGLAGPIPDLDDPEEVTEPSAPHPFPHLAAIEDAMDTAPSAKHPAPPPAPPPANDDDSDEVTSPSARIAVVEITAQLPDLYEDDLSERDADPDRVTRVRGSPDRAPAPGRPGATPVISGRDPRTPPTDSGASDAGLELARAFDRSFTDALEWLRDGEETTSPAAAFPGLPDAALVELSKGIERTQVSRGDIVLREGEPGDACYVIVRGEVRILKRDPINPRGDLIEVTRLADGELFGEFALLADRRRHATVQAVQDCDLFVVPRRLLRRLATRYAEVGPQLERFYRKRLLETLMATAPFFKPLKPERRTELMARFTPRKVDSGDDIVREGDRAGGFFLIVLGMVEITKKVGKHQTVLLASLGEAAYFGEMSLLRGDVARATVRANGPVELAVLSPKDFYDVVADNPVLWDQVRKVAHERELETYEIIAGVTGTV